MPSLTRIIAFFVFPLLAGCACPSPEPPGQTSKQEHVLEQFNIPRGILYMLPVKIQGKIYPFVLDTGATVTVYDTVLRPLLGEVFLSATLHTPDGEMQVPAFSSPPAKLGHLDLPRMSPVFCMDLGQFRELCSREIYGLLGMDFLGKHVFRVDSDRGEVTFLQSADSDSGLRVPITFHNRVPQVQMTLPGLDEQECFKLDTGYAGIGNGDLRADLFDSLVERGILKPAGQVESVTTSGSEIVRKGRLVEISLGHFRHKQLLFSRGKKANSLNINYWSRYVVTFDMPDGAIYLKQGGQFDRADE